jgi:hypothetical protein
MSTDFRPVSGGARHRPSQEGRPPRRLDHGTDFNRGHNHPDRVTIRLATACHSWFMVLPQHGATELGFWALDRA